MSGAEGPSEAGGGAALGASDPALQALRERVLGRKVRVVTDDSRELEGWFVSLDSKGGILLRAGTLVRLGGDREDISPPEPSLGFVLVPGTHVRSVVVLGEEAGADKAEK